MIRLRSEWFLWSVFAISLGLVLFNMITGQKPSQQVIMIQLLGLGCGLIAMMRRRAKK
jgi:hypothetical protein